MVKTTVTVWFLMVSGLVCAQFPALEINLEHVDATVNGTAEISARAGTNWQNITTIRGSLVFDPLVVENPVMVFWGLSHPSGASFQNPSPGVLTYTWASLITIGPNLNPGDVVFTLQYDVVGGLGSASQLNFSDVPVQMYWENGVGWSGNNFFSTNGSITVVVGDDLIFADDFEL